MGTGIGQFFFSIQKQHPVIRVQGYRGMEVSIFEVLFFLTLLVYTAPHIMVFDAVLIIHLETGSLVPPPHVHTWWVLVPPGYYAIWTRS